MRSFPEPWQYIPIFALGLVHVITLLSALFGQTPSIQNQSPVFDFAHAVQSPIPSAICYSAPPTLSPKQNTFGSDWRLNGSMHFAHRVALPISVAILFVSFGWWSLIAVENRSILRRLSE